ncbi:myb domain-containing protein [Reticulomyxa filosa]|uniref:Myb domain-containing protein n=1 Tax=Reticulomyxa filosa TaxID=46433 RepID=X6M904_RETFI|nr:myb domain-containing protein [Reticulomyxa filosa]|eukprot:ETO09505.1 myb domain-containing protein [Reticulomyxa filosa]
MTTEPVLEGTHELSWSDHLRTAYTSNSQREQAPPLWVPTDKEKHMAVVVTGPDNHDNPMSAFERKIKSAFNEIELMDHDAQSDDNKSKRLKKEEPSSAGEDELSNSSDSGNSPNHANNNNDKKNNSNNNNNNNNDNNNNNNSNNNNNNNNIEKNTTADHNDDNDNKDNNSTGDNMQRQIQLQSQRPVLHSIHSEKLQHSIQQTALRKDSSHFDVLANGPNKRNSQSSQFSIVIRDSSVDAHKRNRRRKSGGHSDDDGTNDNHKKDGDDEGSDEDIEDNDGDDDDDDDDDDDNNNCSRKCTCNCDCSEWCNRSRLESSVDKVVTWCDQRPFCVTIHWMRHWLRVSVVNQTWFDHIILLIIILNCIFIAIDQPKYPNNTGAKFVV